MLSSKINNEEVIVESADMIRLIQAYLMEQGLHEAARTLISTSGVGMAGLIHSNIEIWTKAGQWGKVLDSLSTLDRKKSGVPPILIADVHEQAILELAESGSLDLAFAALRLAEEDLNIEEKNDGQTITKYRSLEQRLAALQANHGNLPKHFYGKSSTKQERRNDIAKRLAESIRLVPRMRLPSLIQQAIKWQSYTGQLPFVRDKDDINNDMKPSKKRKLRKTFDIVMGEVEMNPTVGEKLTEVLSESIPLNLYESIKLGKKTTVECSLFLPDGSGLVTGSSDGLIEIWDPNKKYSELRMDLPYQKDEELLGHDSSILALTVSRDGTMLGTGSMDGIVKVWRIDTGKCLRRINAHGDSAITCLDLSPAGSQILVGSKNNTCREFGLKNSAMLKEFSGHISYINSCQYHLLGSQLIVITASADGTVRIWDGNTSETLRILQPPNKKQSIGSSILVEDVRVGSSSVHTAVTMHTPPGSMVIVPRGPCAFLVDLNGNILQMFEESGKIFVAATVSPSNQWLFCVAENGDCLIFDVASGKIETTIRNFASQSTSKTKSPMGSDGGAEISALIHHPQKAILGAYSNDKAQKYGMLTLWK